MTMSAADKQRRADEKTRTRLFKKYDTEFEHIRAYRTEIAEIDGLLRRRELSPELASQMKERATAKRDSVQVGLDAPGILAAHEQHNKGNVRAIAWIMVLVFAIVVMWIISL